MVHPYFHKKVGLAPQPLEPAPNPENPVALPESERVPGSNPETPAPIDVLEPENEEVFAASAPPAEMPASSDSSSSDSDEGLDECTHVVEFVTVLL